MNVQTLFDPLKNSRFGAVAHLQQGRSYFLRQIHSVGSEHMQMPMHRVFQAEFSATATTQQHSVHLCTFFVNVNMYFSGSG